MKKLFALLLALSLCLVLLGCDNEDEPVEVPYIYGPGIIHHVFLTIEEVGDYIIYQNVISVGFCKKDNVGWSTQTLTKEERELMKQTVKLSKNEILTILRNHEDYKSDSRDYGFVILNDIYTE